MTCNARKHARTRTRHAHTHTHTHVAAGPQTTEARGGAGGPASPPPAWEDREARVGHRLTAFLAAANHCGVTSYSLPAHFAPSAWCCCCYPNEGFPRSPLPRSVPAVPDAKPWLTEPGRKLGDGWGGGEHSRDWQSLSTLPGEQHRVEDAGGSQRPGGGRPRTCEAPRFGKYRVLCYDLVLRSALRCRIRPVFRCLLQTFFEGPGWLSWWSVCLLIWGREFKPHRGYSEYLKSLKKEKRGTWVAQ